MSEQGLHPCGGTGTARKGIPQGLALHAEHRKWGAEAFPAQCRKAGLAKESHFTEGDMAAVKRGMVYPGSECSAAPPMPPAPHSRGRAGQQHFSQTTNRFCLPSQESLLTKPTLAECVAARGTSPHPRRTAGSEFTGERASGQVNLRAALGSFPQDGSYNFLHQPSVSCEKKGCEVRGRDKRLCAGLWCGCHEVYTEVNGSASRLQKWEWKNKVHGLFLSRFVLPRRLGH